MGFLYIILSTTVSCLDLTDAIIFLQGDHHSKLIKGIIATHK